MKTKLMFIVAAVYLFMVFGMSAHAHQKVEANQVSVTWDAVTYVVDSHTGDLWLLPEGDAVSYTVYLIPIAADKTDESVILEQGTTQDLIYTITIPEGEFWVGLRTNRLRSAGTEWETLETSVIGWSDDIAIVSDGNTFSILRYMKPLGVTGLRPVQ